MSEIPAHTKNFADFRVCEAICKIEQKEENVLLEFRNTALEDEQLFTVIDNKVFRVGSIHELIHSVPSLVSLSVLHPVRLLWNGSIKAAKIVESFRPSQRSESPLISSLQLGLTVDRKTYETTECYTLQDAIWELLEIIGVEINWKLITCYDCQYSGHARDYSLSDRKYWCYRDVPEAFAEIQAKGKYASPEARFAGSYFVDAFHTCAAWSPTLPRKLSAG